ncbi:MAG: hypothetical protein HY897_07610 [Deltaproteobacteria bacterium]|nr:hypothetical protein [Deltaproteobacteria bacterium]
MSARHASVLAILILAVFLAACSSDGAGETADAAGAADAGSRFDGGQADGGTGTGDAGADAGASDAGAVEDSGADAGEDAGADAGRPTAWIQVDTATVAKKLDPLVNGSGIEIENNAQGLGAEMLLDRGFEWDRPWLQSKGWETWYFFKDDGVEADVEWVTDRVFQGTHSFKFSLTQMQTDKSAGIAQGGLGVVKDREYVFSFWGQHDGHESQWAAVALMDLGVEPPELLADPQIMQIDPAVNKWVWYSAELTPERSTAEAAVAFLVPYPSFMWIDSFSFSPKDARHGIWPELISAFKEAKVAAVRLGGISADGYDWAMGLGPRDKRGVSRSAFADTFLDVDKVVRYMPYYHDVGTDEFLDFCKEIGAEALITANFPLGSQAAANWVEYTNRPSPGLQSGIDEGWKPDSYRSADKAPAGYFAWLREFHGHKDPWRVKYWEVGNELWDEELPEPGSLKGSQNLSNYAVKAREFAVAMKAVDPAIQVGACTSQLPVPGSWDYRSGWNKKVLEIAGDSIDFLAPHFYAPGDFDYDAEAAGAPETTYLKIAGTAPFYAQELAKVQKDIDDWKAGAGGKDVKIAVTEYNVWHGVLEYISAFDNNRLRSVIANAAFRNVNARGPVWMGNFYSLVNHPFGMLDWQADSKAGGKPLLGGNYLLQKFVADHFAPNVHATSVQSPTYTAALWTLPELEAEVLDAVAATNAAGDTMIIIVVNRAYWLPEGIDTEIDLGGFSGASAKAYVLTGASHEVYNSIAAPGEIHLEEETVPINGSKLDYTFRHFSVTAVEVRK